VSVDREVGCQCERGPGQTAAASDRLHGQAEGSHGSHQGLQIPGNTRLERTLSVVGVRSSASSQCFLDRESDSTSIPFLLIFHDNLYIIDDLVILTWRVVIGMRKDM